MKDSLQINSEWNPVSMIPPDELLEVLDDDGNIGIAQPTWYPFKFVPDIDKCGRKISRASECEPYWDGGWMVECIGLDSPVKNIVSWRKLKI